jgi:hypothetical protein
MEACRWASTDPVRQASHQGAPRSRPLRSVASLPHSGAGTIPPLSPSSLSVLRCQSHLNITSSYDLSVEKHSLIPGRQSVQSAMLSPDQWVNSKRLNRAPSCSPLVFIQCIQIASIGKHPVTSLAGKFTEDAKFDQMFG